ncbi:MAG: Rne/Rng family ribonuclease [Pseudomonadota bacterium]|nr:MAG: Rne/Rng family ribonuclease [Pseudomonadota bacterium]
MLINATQPEELRVAIADGQTLLDLDIEVPAQEQKKSNIYKGRITRVEPSLDACFVEFGSERHGFLSLKEISREYFSAKALEALDAGERLDIKDAVQAGQDIIVQVDKEERGTKGAALTTFISLAGRYLVLMPNNPRAGGVSRQITRDERKQLLDTLKDIEIPAGMGAIIRTAGVGRDREELQWDLDYLMQLWDAIQKAATQRKAPFLIYQESNLIIRALRDYLRDDIGEILIDDQSVFEDAREFMQQVMPHNLRKLKAYNDVTPLFSRFQIESQIESAFAREVRLPSGGAVVIDHTEALLSIDINSARATKGADIEETARQTNLEAADEIARQLRIRDLGGLIVIDFIDMMSKEAQREVESRLREAMRMDKARVQIGRISRFGLLEMSRQRLRPSLGESSYKTCPRCDGYGAIRSIESLALSILRLAEEEAMKEQTSRVIVQAPISVANFLLNEKRTATADIEQRNRVPIMVVANRWLETPRFEIQRLRSSESVEEPSYALATGDELESLPAQTQAAPGPAPEPAAVDAVQRQALAPRSARQSHVGWWSTLIGTLRRLFAGSSSEAPDKAPTRQRKHRGKRPEKASGGNGKRTDGNDAETGNRSPGRGKRGGRKPTQDSGKEQARKAGSPTGKPPEGEAKKKKKKKRRRGGKKRRSRQSGERSGSATQNDRQQPDREQASQSEPDRPPAPATPSDSSQAAPDADRTRHSGESDEASKPRSHKAATQPSDATGEQPQHSDGKAETDSRSAADGDQNGDQRAGAKAKSPERATSPATADTERERTPDSERGKSGNHKSDESGTTAEDETARPDRRERTEAVPEGRGIYRIEKDD